MKNNIFFANVYKDEKLIATCLIFKYKNLLHYHLGGSYKEYRIFNPNNFLHYNVIKYGILNNYKLYHLGAGCRENDNLSKFKNRLSNSKFDYTIYKNILNHEIYNHINIILSLNGVFTNLTLIG